MWMLRQLCARRRRSPNGETCLVAAQSRAGTRRVVLLRPVCNRAFGCTRRHRIVGLGIRVRVTMKGGPGIGGSHWRDKAGEDVRVETRRSCAVQVFRACSCHCLIMCSSATRRTARDLLQNDPQQLNAGLGLAWLGENSIKGIWVVVVMQFVQKTRACWGRMPAKPAGERTVQYSTVQQKGRSCWTGTVLHCRCL